MSTNATQRTNLIKRGTSILGANNINKENTKKSLNNSLLNNSLNTSSNLQKGTLQQKLENKIKYRPKENNENDRNAHNINLKRKMTIEVDNTKKTLNNSYNLKNNTTDDPPHLDASAAEAFLPVLLCTLQMPAKPTKWSR